MTSPKRRPMPATSSVDLTELPSQMMAAWHATMILPMAMAVEGLRFAGQRMQAQAEYLSEMAECTSVVGVADAQSRFARTAMSQYQDEGKRIGREMQKIVPSQGLGAIAVWPSA